jgi:hypothetical protein
LNGKEFDGMKPKKTRAHLLLQGLLRITLGILIVLVLIFCVVVMIFSMYVRKNIEKTVDFFLSLGKDYEFRTTLIKEFHDRDNIVNIGKWIKGANKYFLQKFKNSVSCIESHLSAVEDKIANEYVDILKEYIPLTQLRGY